MWDQVKDIMVGACDLHIHAGPDVSPRQQNILDVARDAAGVGIEHCLLFSDFGQIFNPPPVEGYQMFLANLLAVGMEANDLKKAAAVNPARLLGLD